jgi:hypothetical protein
VVEKRKVPFCGEQNRPASDIPEEFQKYFWDVAFKDLSLEKYSRFIAERILNYGDLESVRWLIVTVGMDFISSVVKTSRNLNPKTLNFWQIRLSAPANNFR